MMKSQDMIANESIFGDGGQDMKHPDTDKLGAGAVARGRRRTQRAQRRDSRSRLGDTGDGKAASSRRTPKTEGKQQIPSGRVGTRKDRSSLRKHLRSAKIAPCARDDNAETEKRRRAAALQRLPKTDAGWRRTQRAQTRTWAHKFAGEWGAVGAWILRYAQNDQNTTCRGNFARKGAS
jgi:hypothetical protein